MGLKLFQIFGSKFKGDNLRFYQKYQIVIKTDKNSIFLAPKPIFWIGYT
jgi:hypothetical protein